MRIQKYLSKLGVGSRRQVEKAIESKHIRVNDSVIGLGYEVAVGDLVVWHDLVHKVKASVLKDVAPILIKYHKPLGQVCSKADDQGRPLVFDFLPKPGPWFMVGRLDINTSGLLLFVNRGDIAHALMHPSSGLDRVYHMKISSPLSEEQIGQLQRKVVLDDGPAHFISLSKRPKHARWYVGTMQEGRNRVVRRLIEKVGKQVVKLRRVGYGEIKLHKDHDPGAIVSLTSKEQRWFTRFLVVSRCA